MELHQMSNSPELLQKAQARRPILQHRQVEPVRAFLRRPQGEQPISLSELPQLPLGRGDRVCLDFGTHLVGRLRPGLASSGSHPDAPAFFRLRMAEIRREPEEEPQTYQGRVSRSWIQEEQLRVDVLPARLDLPRRCAFRFMELEVLDTSPKYSLLLQSLTCTAESSADWSAVRTPALAHPLLQRVHRAALLTLAECMQDVFEDGPKRDQRLWMGDFRLQALANYASFRNLDLVARCLYLFGGTRFPDGRISACLFTKPEPAADDTWLPDYALFFPVTLEEYLRESEDPEMLRDLGPIALEQIDHVLVFFDDRLTATPAASEATFVDWCDGLDRRACAQAILLYALPYAISLARRMGDQERERQLSALRGQLLERARSAFWDPELRFFVSGGQVSIASQVWMVLADVLSPEEARDVMERSDAILTGCPMTTPYMYHYCVSALLKAGLREKALDVVKTCWGGMLEAGADTFWESWNPATPDASPYGGLIVNSFCHAWSSTPVFLLQQLAQSDR